MPNINHNRTIVRLHEHGPGSAHSLHSFASSAWSGSCSGNEHPFLEVAKSEPNNNSMVRCIVLKLFHASPGTPGCVPVDIACKAIGSDTNRVGVVGGHCCVPARHSVSDHAIISARPSAITQRFLTSNELEGLGDTLIVGHLGDWIRSVCWIRGSGGSMAGGEMGTWSRKTALWSEVPEFVSDD